MLHRPGQAVAAVLNPPSRPALLPLKQMFILPPLLPPLQVLILPPFQGLGLGKKMLQIAYRMAVEKKCLDLTVRGGEGQRQWGEHHPER